MSTAELVGSPQDWRILCVDDEPNILSSLRRLFRQAGYQVLIANGGAEGLQVLEKEAVDLVISDMRMPEMDGAAFLNQVRQFWPDCLRILLTGYADITSTIEAINKGEIFRYISKPWDDNDLLLIVRHALERKALEREKLRLEALTAKQNEELKDLNANLELKVAERTAELSKANEKLKNSFLTSIKVFANLIGLRGGPLAGHSRRVADLARKIAVKMKVPSNEVQDIFLAGLLHDLGKMGFSDALLVKPMTHLTNDELEAFRKHPVTGQQSLMALDELSAAAKILRSHHERFDGFGFPDALAGQNIPLGARILAVANDYDRLQLGALEPRRYTAEDARKVIIDGRGRRYDPQVVDAFVKVAGGADQYFTKIEVPFTELKPGMVLAKDFESRDGMLLLAADYVLDERLIRHIRDYAVGEGLRLVLTVRAN